MAGRVVNLMTGGVVTGGAGNTTGAWVEIPGPGQHAHGRSTVFIVQATATSSPVLAIEQSIDASTAYPTMLIDGVTAATQTLSGTNATLLDIEPHSKYLRAKLNAVGTATGVNVSVVF